MILDVDETVGRMTFALKQAIGADLPVLGGACGVKARAVAQYAGFIADAYAAGALDDRQMREELREIEHMTRRVTQTSRGVAGASAERAGKAAVAALFGALRAGLSLSGAPVPAELFQPEVSASA